MLLNEGDRILVSHRRLFEKDEVRFFIGRVDAYDDGTVKATGHSYIRDALSGNIIEKADERIKIISITSGTLLVYQIPNSADFGALKFVVADGRLILTDDKNFMMNLAEHTHGGRA